MSIVMEYPVETAQMKVVAANHQLDNLRVFIPDHDDIDYADDTMIVFSNTRYSTAQGVLEFSRRVGAMFRKNVYVTPEYALLDSNEILKANQHAELV